VLGGLARTAGAALLRCGEPAIARGTGRLLTCKALCPAFDSLADQLRDLGHLVHPNKGVHLGQQLGQLLAEALRQAASHDQRLAPLLGLAQMVRFQNGIHTLFLSRVDEGAGINDERVGCSGVVGELDALLFEGAQHDLCVHQILGTTQTNHGHPQRAAGRLMLGGLSWLRHSHRSRKPIRS
jgi:hypothetical protein